MAPGNQCIAATPPESCSSYSTYSFPFAVAFTCTPSLLSFKPPSRPSTPNSTRRIRFRYAVPEFRGRCLTSTTSPSLNCALDLPDVFRKDRSACPPRRIDFASVSGAAPTASVTISRPPLTDILRKTPSP